jgi:serine/threonine-protein phosphatase 2A regulatory subunit B
MLYVISMSNVLYLMDLSFNWLVFEEEEDPSNKSFFSEILASINDIKFSPDGRYILSRDYLTLKVWDINMDSKPVKTINIHDYVRPKLVDLYDQECLFDRFECQVSGDAKYIHEYEFCCSFMIDVL